MLPAPEGRVHRQRRGCQARHRRRHRPAVHPAQAGLEGRALPGREVQVVQEAQLSRQRPESRQCPEDLAGRGTEGRAGRVDLAHHLDLAGRGLHRPVQ